MTPTLSAISSCRVVLDCEFTDLERPQLLSVGMVSGEGARLYLELDLNGSEGQARARLASDFTRDQVLEHFGLSKAVQVASAKELGERAQAWLLGLSGQNIELLYDYPADYALLEAVLRTQSQWDLLELRLRPRNIVAECDCIDAELAAEACFQALKTEGLYRHHALADALALQAAYGTVHSEGVL